MNNLGLRLKFVFAVLLSNSCVGSIFAQSTSPWMPATDMSISALPTSALANPNLGDAYITIDFVSARVYQKSNWWTNLVERNRSGVVDVTLTGEVNGQQISDIRSSKPIVLRKNDSLIDFGFATNLVSKLPSVYRNLQMHVRLSKSSKDGLDELLTTLSEISGKTPSLQVSQSTLGIVSGSKALADYLFGKSLLKEHLNSVMGFPESSTSLPAGLYIVLAGDSAADYSDILNKPLEAVKQKLVWNGATLVWDGKTIEKLSYFVVRVSYEQRVFASPLSSISFFKTKPWAALYQVAGNKADNLTTRDDADKVASEITNHLSNAGTLLDADPDYVQGEKQVIKDTVRENIQTRINTRIAKLPGTGTKTVVLTEP